MAEAKKRASRNYDVIAAIAGFIIRLLDNEELRYIPDLIKEGGYVPHLDHNVPPNIPWENYKYYRNKLNDIIGSTKVLCK